MRTISRTMCPMLLATVLIAGVKSARADSPKDEVVAEWRMREQSARTINGAIDELRTVTRGTLTGLSTGLDGTRAPIDPAEDTTKLFTRALILDDDRMMHSCAGDQWAARAREFLPEKMISVCDGKVARSVHLREENTDLVHSSGYIHATPVHPDRRDHFLAPLLMHFRPFSSAFGWYNADNWTVVATDSMVDKSVCTFIREGQETDVRFKEFWVDRAQGMSVVQYRERFKGRIAVEIKIKYRRDETNGWIPSAWSTKYFDKEKVLDEHLGSVTDLSINAALPGGAFSIEFPPGTRVSDYATRKSYIVRADGSFFEITPAHRGLTHTQLLNRSEDEPSREEGMTPFFPFGVTFIVMAALSLAIASVGFARVRNKAMKFSVVTVGGICIIVGPFLVVGNAECGAGCQGAVSVETVQNDQYAFEVTCDKIWRMDPPNANAPGFHFYVRVKRTAGATCPCAAAFPLNALCTDLGTDYGGWLATDADCTDACVAAP